VDRGIARPFRDLGARSGGWSTSRPGLFKPGIDLIPIVQEAGWAPGPLWTCVKNLAYTGMIMMMMMIIIIIIIIGPSTIIKTKNRRHAHR
jgi:hypothetical protein